MKKILIFIFNIISLNIVIAQEKVDFVPPSPKAQAFNIYGDYPVSYNTGVPNISIPLYNISLRDIKIPINISYHLGSIKPSIDCSTVGFGWVLNYGGTLSRTIKGLPDESSEFYPAKEGGLAGYQFDELNDEEGMLLRDIVDQIYDTEYDEFNYTTQNTSGKFYLVKNGDNYSVVEFSKTANKFKINLVPKSGNNKAYIRSIEITEENGNKYIFGETFLEKTIGSIPCGEAVTSWMLAKIETVSSGDIFFNYSTYNYDEEQENPESSTLFIKDAITTGSFAVEFPDSEYKINYPETNPLGNFHKNMYTIQRITFRDGMLRFNLSSDNKHINSVDILKLDNSLIHKIEFMKSPFSNSSYTRLDALKKISGDKQLKEYAFVYNNSQMNVTTRTDYWGYFINNDLGLNATQRNYSVVENLGGMLNTINLELGVESRLPDNPQNYALNTIKYPTGGETNFEYEPNYYQGDSYDNNQVKKGGGLRIYKITSKTNKGGVNTKTFSYSPGKISYSYNNPSVYTSTSYKIKEHKTVYVLWESHRLRSFQNVSNPGLGANHVLYGKVTEYNGSVEENNGKIVYYYNNVHNETYASPYTWMSEFVNSAGSMILHSVENKGGSLLRKKEVYNSGGVKKQTTNYEYHTVDKSEIKNFRVFNYTAYCSESDGVETTPLVLEQLKRRKTLLQLYEHKGAEMFTPVYGYYYTKIIPSRTYKSKEIVTDFFNGGQISRTTHFQYNTKNQLTVSYTTDSEGEIVRKEYKYPNSFSTPVCDSMVARNILIPVEQKVLKNGVQINGSKSEYNFFNNKILKSSSKVWNSDNIYETKLILKKYDTSGNLVEYYNPEENVYTSYVWGYNGQYPILKAVNARYDDVKTYAVGGTVPSVAGALITTYDYYPLIGLKEQTDPNGRKTTYEYDDFNRLKLIRDNENKIVKEIKYKYATEQ